MLARSQSHRDPLPRDTLKWAKCMVALPRNPGLPAFPWIISPVGFPGARARRLQLWKEGRTRAAHPASPVLASLHSRANGAAQHTEFPGFFR